MANFYAYKGNEKLGSEPLGTEEKIIFELKTIHGAINRCKRVFKDSRYMLYKFANFYDDTTFQFIVGNL